MPNKDARRLLTRLFALSLLVISLAFVTGSTTTKRQLNTPQVINTTKALEVLNVTRGDGAYVLRLRNNSNKAVNGLSVGTSPTSRHDVDYTIGDHLLSTGEVTEVDVPVSGSQDSARPQSVYVFAVLFVDGSVDGDPKVVADNQHRRLGIKIQLQRISHYIDSALKSADANSLSLESLKSQISSLPETPEPGQPGVVRSGLHSGKQSVLSQIEQLGQDAAQRGISSPQALALIRDQVNKRLSKL